MTTRIVVRFTFEGIHSWPGAESDTPWWYLKHPHRHLFHVEAKKAVTHDDRDVEFIDFKNRMQEWAAEEFSGHHTLSCEMMAKRLLEKYGLDSCAVFEDNENGAEVCA